MPHTNINRVILVGRLTRDPETRATPSGRGLCSLRVACNGLRKNEEGAYSERPNFFDVSVFGPAAEAVQRFTRKGSRVAVDGRLEWREWETEEKQRRQAVNIVADSVEFLDGPDGEQEEWAPQGGDPGMQESDLLGVGAGAEVVF
jgi:single-strand DNA-binding protein